jgi:hypothetical protein
MVPVGDGTNGSKFGHTPKYYLYPFPIITTLSTPNDAKSTDDKQAQHDGRDGTVVTAIHLLNPYLLVSDIALLLY